MTAHPTLDAIRGILAEHPELETWAGHFEMRVPELVAVERLAGFGPNDRVLEVGCGNGLSAAYFSPLVASLVATDLPEEDPSAHSIGLERAVELMEMLGLSNVTVEGASAVDLPFPDESFDAAYSLYVLEHVPDRHRALQETRRVLKPGGRMIATVPASAHNVVYPIHFYVDTMARLLRRIGEKLRRRRVTSGGPQAPGGPSTPAAPTHRIHNWRTFREAYPQFPLPKPHGEYAHFVEEWSRQRPSRWVESLREAGFTNIEAFPLTVLPRGLFYTFGGRLGLSFFEFALSPIDRRIKKRSWAVPLAQYLCLVATKGNGDRGGLQ